MVLYKKGNEMERNSSICLKVKKSTEKNIMPYGILKGDKRTSGQYVMIKNKSITYYSITQFVKY